MGNTLDEKSLDRAAQPSHTTIVEEQTSSVSKKQGLLSPDSANAEFDPCAIAKPCSPFYLYKHESPRPSMEQSHLKVHDSSIHVSVYDLEAEGLTPAVSQIKKKPSSESPSICEGPSWKQRYWLSRPPNPSFPGLCCCCRVRQITGLDAHPMSGSTFMYWLYASGFIRTC